MIYARNVVHYGEGVIEDEDGSRRAEKETDLCPECALYVSQDKHKDDIARLGLMVRAIASAERAGYPQWQLEAMAAGWEKRMAKGSIEDSRSIANTAWSVTAQPGRATALRPRFSRRAREISCRQPPPPKPIKNCCARSRKASPAPPCPPGRTD
jgi:hypothetical protein